MRVNKDKNVLAHMTNKDNNGMTAADWKSASTKAINQRKLHDVKDNVELFEQIKGIVSDAVTIIRGSAKSDDKYRNIVDLIMMRVRGALDKKFSNLDEIELDTDKIVTDISEQLQQKIKEYSNNLGSNTNSASIDMKQLADYILNTISTLFQSNIQTNNKSEEQTDNLADTAKQEQTIEDNTTNQYQQMFDSVQQQFNQLNDVITSSMAEITKKLDNICMSVETGISTMTDTQDIISETIDYDYCEKCIYDCIDRLEQVIKTISNTGAKPVAGNEKQNKTLNRQLYLTKKLINDNFDIINYTLNNSTDFLYKHIIQQDKILNDIVDRMKKSSIPFAAILMLVGIIGGVLVTAFWPQIKEFLDNIDFEKYFNIVFDSLGDIYNKIEPYVQPVLASIGDAILKTFSSILSNPMDYVVNKFKQLYDAFVEFKNDVWGWITGKTKETAQARDEQEKKAEEKVTSQLDSALKTTDNMTAAHEKELEEKMAENKQQLDNAVKNADEKTTEQTNQLTSSAEGCAKSIEEQTNAAVENTNKITSDMAKDAQTKTDGVTNNVLPNATKEVTKSTDKNINGLEAKLNENIKKAEQKADENIAAAEERAKAEGNPTEVTTDSLNKLNSASEGADLSGGVDKKPTTPTDIEKVTVTEQNKTTALYTNKADAAKLKENEQQVNDINNAMSTNQGQPNANKEPSISSKLVVKADTPDLKQGTPEDFRDIVKHAENIESVFAAGNKILENVITDISNYFKDLNTSLDKIEKNQKLPQQQSSKSSTGSTSQQPLAIIIAPPPNTGMSENR